MKKVVVSVTETLRQLHLGGQWEAALEACHFLRQERIRLYPETLFLAADSLPPPTGNGSASDSFAAASVQPHHPSPSVDEFIGAFCHPSEQPSLKALYNRTRDPVSADIVGANLNYCSRAYHWNDALRLVANCTERGVTTELRGALLRPGGKRAQEGILVGLDMISRVCEQHANSLSQRGSARSTVPWLVVAKSLVTCATFVEQLGDGLSPEASGPLLERLAATSRTVAPMCDSWRTAVGLLAITHKGRVETHCGETKALLQSLCQMTSWWVQIQGAALSQINSQGPYDGPESLASRLVLLAHSPSDALAIVRQIQHGPTFVAACLTLLQKCGCDLDRKTIDALWCQLGDAAAFPATDVSTTADVAVTLYTLSGSALEPSSSLRALLTEWQSSSSSVEFEGKAVITAILDVGKPVDVPDQARSTKTNGQLVLDVAVASDDRPSPPPRQFVRRFKNQSSEPHTTA